jgi:hypothetical protein
MKLFLQGLYTKELLRNKGVSCYKVLSYAVVVSKPVKFGK